MSMPARYGGVVLIGFGGPSAAGELRAFLDRVTAGRSIPRERYELVLQHYEAIGGRSPFNEVAARQAQAVGARLAADGAGIAVALGLRNSAPFIEDAIRRLVDCGSKRMLGFVLSAFRCEASWDRYLEAARDACDRIGASATQITYVGEWHTHPLFVEANADRIAEALASFEPTVRAGAQLIFTAHSIPVAMAGSSTYAEQFTDCARLVAKHLGRRNWTLAFQSRSGDPRAPWLAPDICDVLRSLEGQPAVVAPIGFLCDHVEVLYDLDIEAARVAREAGVKMMRAATVGEHPRFIEMMAALIRERLV
jgi:protoporphyrin/coproporphyrin ferrochelatase